MIFLIRHGETELNATRVVQTPDAPLNPRGVAQARRLARRLAEHGVEHVLSSDLARARATAESIVEATGARLELDASLQERNFGDVRGTPYAELETDIFASGYAPPGGEDGPSFERRVDAAWQGVVACAGGVSGNLAVVTHGLVCASLAQRYLTLPPDYDGEPLRWSNTSLTIFDALPPWTVRLLNCAAHLDDEGSGAQV